MLAKRGNIDGGSRHDASSIWQGPAHRPLALKKAKPANMLKC